MQTPLQILQYRPNNKHIIEKEIIFFEKILYEISYKKYKKYKKNTNKKNRNSKIKKNKK